MLSGEYWTSIALFHWFGALWARVVMHFVVYIWFVIISCVSFSPNHKWLKSFSFSFKMDYRIFQDSYHPLYLNIQFVLWLILNFTYCSQLSCNSVEPWNKYLLAHLQLPISSLHLWAEKNRWMDCLFHTKKYYLLITMGRDDEKCRIISLIWRYLWKEFSTIWIKNIKLFDTLSKQREESVK